MEIIATGFCEDCDETVPVDFDDDSGAPFCAPCGSYDVIDVETEETDTDADRLISFLALDDDEEDELYSDEYEGVLVDDEF